MESLEEKVERLRAELLEAELEMVAKGASHSDTIASASATPHAPALAVDELGRYSRHLLLPDIAYRGQCAMKRASVLIVGAGGLGCPAALYLAAAGIGRLGIVDFDEVDSSNLQRQVAHDESRVGVNKAESLAITIQRLNSFVRCDVYKEALTVDNAIDIISQYDIVVDATDNVETRYLISDSCVVCDRVLVSGSALRMDGQLTTYHFGTSGPCYRCLFPVPPPPETVTNCSDGGVLGVVPGLIGLFQALEVIRIVTLNKPNYHERMVVLDCTSGAMRVIRLRSRNPQCVACGADADPQRNESSSDSSASQALATARVRLKEICADYRVFCQSDQITCGTQLVHAHERLTPKEIESMRSECTLIDVRPSYEFEIGSIPGAINIPLHTLRADPTTALATHQNPSPSPTPVVVLLCRRGNDSQHALIAVRDAHVFPSGVRLCDLKGGLVAWQQSVQPDFPIY